MLTCKDFLSELSAYLDEQTDAELKAKIEKHVTECPNCWVVADTTKKTIKVYKGMDADGKMILVDPDHDFIAAQNWSTGTLSMRFLHPRPQGLGIRSVTRQCSTRLSCSCDPVAST